MAMHRRNPKIRTAGDRVRSALGVLALALALTPGLSPGPATAFVCLSPTGGVPGDPSFCSRWTNGFVRVKSLLGISGGQLFNGTASWDQNVFAAANNWNEISAGIAIQVLGGEFINPCGRQNLPQHACTDTGPEGDNPIFFADSICGAGFGDIIAQTTNCFTPAARNSRMVNSPVFFNRNERWNAYDGALRSDGIIDLRRVALHELGHVIGLVHPDENGQFISAIMNRRVSNLDRLRADDVDGALFLYGGGVPQPGGPPEGASSGCHLAPSSRGSLAWIGLLPAALLLRRRRCVPADLAGRGEQ